MGLVTSYVLCIRILFCVHAEEAIYGISSIMSCSCIVSARGKYLSVYVCLLPGKYDALLTWPFSHRVTFTLITPGRNSVTSGRNNVTSGRNNVTSDRNSEMSGCNNETSGRNSVTSSLKPSPCKENAPFLWRPGKKRNPSFGVEKFVKLSTVADYVLDDCLYLSIKVDLTGMSIL